MPLIRGLSSIHFAPLTWSREAVLAGLSCLDTAPRSCSVACSMGIRGCQLMAAQLMSKYRVPAWGGARLVGVCLGQIRFWGKEDSGRSVTAVGEPAEQHCVRFLCQSGLCFLGGRLKLKGQRSCPGRFSSHNLICRIVGQGISGGHLPVAQQNPPVWPARQLVAPP